VYTIQSSVNLHSARTAESGSHSIVYLFGSSQSAWTLPRSKYASTTFRCSLMSKYDTKMLIQCWLSNKNGVQKPTLQSYVSAFGLILEYLVIFLKSKTVEASLYSLTRQTAADDGQLTSASTREIFRHTLIISLSDESVSSTTQFAANRHITQQMNNFISSTQYINTN